METAEAEIYDFRPDERRDPMVLIGKCSSCRRGLRIECSLGRASTRLLQQRQMWGDRCAAFLTPVGRVLVAVVGSWHDGAWHDCECGGRIRLRKLDGKYNRDKRCSARCTNATGPSCECACGGANHGAGHA